MQMKGKLSAIITKSSPVTMLHTTHNHHSSLLQPAPASQKYLKQENISDLMIFDKLSWWWTGGQIFPQFYLGFIFDNLQMDVSSRNHKKTSVQLILSWSMHAASRMRKYWVVTVMFIICCDKWADKMIICLKAMCLYSCKMLNKAKYGNWQHLITLKISASSAIHPRLANMSTFYITHNTPTEQTIYFHH